MMNIFSWLGVALEIVLVVPQSSKYFAIPEDPLGKFQMFFLFPNVVFVTNLF